MIPRRRALLGALPLLAAPALPRAEEPRPVRVVVPFPAGGGVDVFARPFAAALSGTLRRPVVVENTPGASSRLGTAAVLRAPADGRTLLVTNDTLAAIEALPVAGSPAFVAGLAPVLLGISAPQVVVTHPRSGLADAAALAERLRSPRPPTLGIPGIGSSQHFAAASFVRAVGGAADYVPYRGGNEVIAALLSGTIETGVIMLGMVAEHVRAGRLRGLALMAAGRHPLAPMVPTAAETVAPGVEETTWVGVLAPSGTPAATLAALHAASEEALRDPVPRERFAAIGYDVVGAGPDAFAATIADTVRRYAAAARAANIRPDAA